MTEEPTLFTIGHYKILRKIGQGGMGEVFLAYDPICGRKIALKRVREDRRSEKLKQRFLKEARLTSQLTHPAIIPIYAIHDTEEGLYYTMPYVEGKNLRQIIKQARDLEIRGDKPSIHATIPALTRILLSVCQAIAYAHSHGVLHRDIKGENILIGKFGEVVILDWGLAKGFNEKDEEEEESEEEPGITRLGKVVGTVSYLSPERAEGAPASVQSDIYSLGVILYYILTLNPPFVRKSLEEFQKNVHFEELKDPSLVAPYRDVPPMLTEVVQKCLAPKKEARYRSTSALIHDLENYIEGRAEWFESCTLSINRKEDWQFQENVLIAEHTAITEMPESSEWVSLMISQRSFSENVRLTTQITLESRSHGIGFLLAVPEEAEREHLSEGYSLWIGTPQHPGTKLVRSSVEVLTLEDVTISPETSHDICIEKMENCLYVAIDGQVVLSYISHLPMTGTHVGIVAKDADFTLDPLTISVGGHSAKVSCLAVPDAFLAHREYERALTEYRRIAYTFPGRVEGREALFRAGVALLEKAKREDGDYEAALEEFSKLHGTPGAPLEYLGKALAYEALKDEKEEIKCYMMVFRRYPHHPLLHVIQEHLLYRFHEFARYSRHATYKVAFLIVRHMPKLMSEGPTKRLFESLKRHMEDLPFIQEDITLPYLLKTQQFHSCILIAFWLAKPLFLEEIIHQLLKVKLLHKTLIENALYCLTELGAYESVEKVLKLFEKLKEEEGREELNKLAIQFQPILSLKNEGLEKALQSTEDPYLLSHLLSRAIDFGYPELVLGIKETKEAVPYILFSLLLQKKWDEAGSLFDRFPMEELSKEDNILYFLYGCWLQGTEGTEIARVHFSGVLASSFPRSWALGAHAITGMISEGERWYSQSFLMEKRALFRQLYLYYSVAQEKEKSHHSEKKLREQWPFE